MKKNTSKSPVKKFISLFKNPFMWKRESVSDFRRKKKAEAEIMIRAVEKILKKRQGSIDDSIASMDDDGSEIYFYDFISEYGGGIQSGFEQNYIDGDSIVSGFTVNSSGTTTIRTIGISSAIEKIEPKAKLKPIDVFHELEKVPVPILMENLHEKIATLKMKKQFIRNNKYAKKEVIDMVTRLENRLKYKEFEPFFSKYDNTTTDKINALVNKYDLVLRTSDLFIPKFPKEAMDIMVEYKENVKKLCNKMPIFYVIAEKAMFKEEEKRNDPILLVQSPFGIYWQILGAWDKELVLLEEL